MNADPAAGDRVAPPRSVELPPTADSPRSARRFVQDVLRGNLDEDTLDSALLLVTELVTNVVVHAGTVATVGITLESAGVRVSVSDRHPVRIGVGRRETQVVRPRPAAPDDLESLDGLGLEGLDGSPDGLEGLREDGRGLALVDALASSWGTEHVAGGKTVWFRLTAAASAQPPEGTPTGAARGAEGAASTEGRSGAGNAPNADGTRTTERAEGAAVVAPSDPGSAGVPPRLPRLIARDTARALSAEGEVSELLAQLLDALPASGGVVRRPAADGVRVETVAAMGRAGTDAQARVFPLDPTQDSLGELLLWPSVEGTASGAVGPADSHTQGRAEGHSEGHHGFDVERVQLVSRWMALALGGGDMRRAEERRIGMLSFLAEASDLLAGNLDLARSLALLARLPVPRLAQWCAVYLNHEGANPTLEAFGHAEESQTAALTRAAVDPDGALMAAVRAARGDQVQMVTAFGGPALVVVLQARRRVLGVLALGRAPGHAFLADEMDLLADLARRAAFAVDNARLYSRQVELAGTLQAGLRPPALPNIPGIDLGSAYGAAQSAGLDVGGDFFDLIHGPNGWTVAIGDVCGKGAEAATVTGVARAVLRLLTGRGAALEELLLELNRALRDTATAGNARFCTMAAASMLPLAGGNARFHLHLAGHPQPVVLHQDGSASLVGLAGTLLGVLDDDEISFPGLELQLQAGESLVLYTDGVVEARQGRELFGEQRLVNAVAGCHGLSAQGVADRVLSAAERFAGGNLRDDVAILVARVAD
ncbi:Serine phosphatase RsbU, regulator of sigma subunit [Parafrankia irregularis]|uniref:Serine phosphatase RsbU, regulator of sigma subunit n=1 Tax=Parafrankia irregularis TaxID=795642 RepID=A0A0S4QU82_9ACTN|nr:MULTISPECIES: SpoIIE family protein phosphatase [Parafrankia]MBE3204935.1 SpoIIE family protein phosphatase [Parafrankia sp. CH37]CUU58594.1 Serine phosphatase RsbU, regulator of sigma subunit [Parafrankia irregularis]